MADTGLTHLDAAGNARMVDVGNKAVTTREAMAEAFIVLQPSTMAAIGAGAVPKGEVLNTARIAGILAAKRCGELIPLCHPLSLESVSINFEMQQNQIRITSVARITAKTGVEMEALMAVSMAALTIYDMCKAIDKSMRIEGVRVVMKHGGKNDFHAGV